VATAWVGGAVFVACGIGFTVWGVLAAYTQFSLRYGGATTQAQIVQVQQVSKDLECEVSYQNAAGAQYEAWLDDQCRGMQPGESIAVKYLPGDPTTVAAVGSLSLVVILVNKSGYLFVGLGTLLFALLGILASTGVLERWVARRRARTRTRMRRSDP
jgi:hypothetical protein